MTATRSKKPPKRAMRAKCKPLPAPMPRGWTKPRGFGDKFPGVASHHRRGQLYVYFDGTAAYESRDVLRDTFPLAALDALRAWADALKAAA